MIKYAVMELKKDLIFIKENGSKGSKMVKAI